MLPEKMAQSRTVNSPRVKEKLGAAMAGPSRWDRTKTALTKSAPRAEGAKMAMVKADDNWVLNLGINDPVPPQRREEALLTNAAWTYSAAPPRTLALPPTPQPENPDPLTYRDRRGGPPLKPDDAEALGIEDSPWEPFADYWPRADGFEPRSLADLRGYAPTRMRFTCPHPEDEVVEGLGGAAEIVRAEMSDAWFETLFLTLYQRVWRLGERHFGAAGDLAWPNEEEGGWWSGSLWVEADLPARFVSCAAQVAGKDDRVGGGWDRLLADRDERMYLVMGVLAKLLDEHVFSDLLFGGSAEHRHMLEQWDELMVQEDGYFRKAKRARETRYFLAGRILTPHFWERVDALAAQTTALLLPLVNLQGRLAGWRDCPRLVGLYQDVHDVVAHAGYAAVCMAYSASVFFVQFPEPGQTWDLEQENEDHGVFLESVARGRRWDEMRALAAAGGDGDADAAGGGNGVVFLRHPETYRHEYDDDALNIYDDEDDEDDSPARPLRVAKVKIVLWPLIKRFKPLGPVTADGALDGERVSVLRRSRVVYYAGLTDDASVRAERRPTLQRYIAVTRRRARLARLAAPAVTLLLAAGLLLLLFVSVVSTIVLVRNLQILRSGGTSRSGSSPGTPMDLRVFWAETWQLASFLLSSSSLLWRPLLPSWPSWTSWMLSWPSWPSWPNFGSLPVCYDPDKPLSWTDTWLLILRDIKRILESS